MSASNDATPTGPTENADSASTSTTIQEPETVQDRLKRLETYAELLTDMRANSSRLQALAIGQMQVWLHSAHWLFAIVISVGVFLGGSFISQSPNQPTNMISASLPSTNSPLAMSTNTISQSASKSNDRTNDRKWNMIRWGVFIVGAFSYAINGYAIRNLQREARSMVHKMKELGYTGGVEFKNENLVTIAYAVMALGILCFYWFLVLK